MQANHSSTASQPLARYRKILVTGADGFIGSHLTEYLLNQGAEVRAFVMYNSFNSWGWLDHLPAAMRKALDVFSGDLRDPSGVRTAARGCDAIAHLGALIAIPYSYHSPATYIDTNVTGTLNILQAARDLDVARVVHTSTSEVYGSAQYVPIDEAHPLCAQSPYAASKIAADQLALSYYRSFDTPVTVIRPFNTYGPRQSARAIIPTIITQLLTGDGHLQLGTLTPTRDFNYVADTVGGFTAMLGAEGVEGEVINFGSGQEISIGALAHIISETLGVTPIIQSDETRVRPDKSEVDRLLANHQRALSLTGWQPQFAGEEGLRRGLATTIDWFKQSTNLAHYKPSQYNI